MLSKELKMKILLWIHVMQANADFLELDKCVILLCWLGSWSKRVGLMVQQMKLLFLEEYHNKI